MLKKGLAPSGPELGWAAGDRRFTAFSL